MTEIPTISITNLPMTFTIQYLGNHPVKGLQGMKYTRPAVEYLVSEAKKMKSNEILPKIKFQVTKDEVNYTYIADKSNKSKTLTFTSDSISYCVQDVKYSRIFSMVIVTENAGPETTLFNCHSFLCESSNQATKITSALSVVLLHCGEKLKGLKKKVVVNLRTDENQSRGEDLEDEMDV